MKPVDETRMEAGATSRLGLHALCRDCAAEVSDSWKAQILSQSQSEGGDRDPLRQKLLGNPALMGTVCEPRLLDCSFCSH